MKIEKVGLLILCFVLTFSSCKKDDDGSEIVTIEERDRTEQEIEDQIALNNYLSNHYYNASFFVDKDDPSISDIEITELAEEETTAPDGYTLLSEAVEEIPVVFAETNYIVHVLRINQGDGDASPTFADNVLVVYEGYTLEDNFNVLSEAFDSKINPDDPFDLLRLIPGWRKVLPTFNTADGFEENEDGTINFKNPGLGIMFLPSGLAYFSGSTGSIGTYTPIAFKFELLRAFENDHDGDGIPSYMEELTGDSEFTGYNGDDDVEDDDTDNDTVPDYFDADDDGDGIPTSEEDINDDGIFTNDDTNQNGIPNYLDPEDTESK